MKKKAGILLMMLVSSYPLFAHEAVSETENISGLESAVFYVRMGFEHILPQGFDHILFVLSLFLLSNDIKTLCRQSLAFTVAHSVTLGLAMFNVVDISPGIVEPLIALSILYVALENIFVKKLRPSRIGLVFLFGLVHGLGFAGSLSNLGLPPDSFLGSLLLFNAGVELGQLAVILLAYFAIGKWFGKKPYYHKYFVTPLSLMIAAVALFWVVQRTLV